jgi:hypothetical protein
LLLHKIYIFILLIIRGLAWLERIIFWENTKRQWWVPFSCVLLYRCYHITIVFTYYFFPTVCYWSYIFILLIIRGLAWLERVNFLGKYEETMVSFFFVRSFFIDVISQLFSLTIFFLLFVIWVNSSSEVEGAVVED